MPIHKDPQLKADEIAIAKVSRNARRAFRELLPKIQPLVAEVLGKFPGKDPKSKTLRDKNLVGVLFENPDVVQFLEMTFTGLGPQEAIRQKALVLLKEVALGSKPLLESLETLDGLAISSFQHAALAQDRAVLEERIPESVREFLSKNLVVEVDPDGSLKRVTERFGNASRTIEAKINRMKLIVREYNRITKQVKKDLESPDEITRFAAIVTAIIMETGIRPGGEGNAATIRAEGGEKIVVETFGAVTLGPSHVEFVRDNFAKLEFVGKKGTLNTAFLSDEYIIKILQDYVEKARAGGSKFIFVTSKGESFSYYHLQRYFNAHFAGIDPTDFRKLRAAQTVFSELKTAQEALYEKIRSFADAEEKILRERVLDAVRETLGEAIEKSRAALSHKSQSETIDSYLDPRITLQFLSRGQMAQTLHDAILDDDFVVSFNPMNFVNLAASAKKVADKWLRKQARGDKPTLRDLLEKLEESIA